MSWASVILIKQQEFLAVLHPPKTNLTKQITSYICIREGEKREEFSEAFAVLDKDQDTVISREGQPLGQQMLAHPDNF